MPSNKTLYLPLMALLLLMGIQTCYSQNIYTRNTWKERDQWQQVPLIMNTIGITKGDVVADIGSHEGYMTFKFVSEVGKSGKVYAVDVNKSRLRTLDKILEEKKINNVETVHGDYDNPNLPVNSINCVFIMDAYHEMDSYKQMLKHIKLSLTKNGKLVILEPIAEKHRAFSRQQQAEKHDIGIEYVIEDLEAAGFNILIKKDRFIDRAPKKKDHLWILIAEVDKSQ